MRVLRLGRLRGARGAAGLRFALLLSMERFAVAAAVFLAAERVSCRRRDSFASSEGLESLDISALLMLGFALKCIKNLVNTKIKSDIKT